MTASSFDVDPSHPSARPCSSATDSSEEYSRSPHLISYLNSIGETLGAESWSAGTLKPSGVDASRMEFKPLDNARSNGVSALQQILQDDLNDRKSIDRSGIHPTRFYATFYHEDSLRPFFISVVRIAPNCLLGVRFKMAATLSNTKSSQVHHAEAALQALARFSGRPYDFQSQN